MSILAAVFAVIVEQGEWVCTSWTENEDNGMRLELSSRTTFEEDLSFHTENKVRFLDLTTQDLMAVITFQEVGTISPQSESDYIIEDGAAFKFTSLFDPYDNFPPGFLEEMSEVVSSEMASAESVYRVTEYDNDFLEFIRLNSDDVFHCRAI